MVRVPLEVNNVMSANLPEVNVFSDGQGDNISTVPAKCVQIKIIINPRGLQYPFRAHKDLCWSGRHGRKTMVEKLISSSVVKRAVYGSRCGEIIR